MKNPGWGGGGGACKGFCLSEKFLFVCQLKMLSFPPQHPLNMKFESITGLISFKQPFRISFVLTYLGIKQEKVICISLIFKNIKKNYIYIFFVVVYFVTDSSNKKHPKKAIERGWEDLIKTLKLIALKWWSKVSKNLILTVLFSYCSLLIISAFSAFPKFAFNSGDPSLWAFMSVLECSFKFLYPTLQISTHTQKSKLILHV